MKKTSLRGLLGVSAALTVASAMADPVQVTVNGTPVQFNSAQPQMIGGRVFVPLRGVFEMLGATVDWDSSTQSVMADGNGQHVRLQLESLDASVNGRIISMDVAPQLIDNSTMVPLRFLSQALGAKVDWQPQNELVAISSIAKQGRAQQIISPPPPPPPVIVSTPVPPPPTVIIQKVEVPPPPAPFVISRDMVIPLTLDEDVTSNGSKPGDHFTATVRDSAGRYLDFPEGTMVEGSVVAAAPASGSHGGTLDVRFTYLKFPDGSRYKIGGVVTRWDNKYIVRTDSGKYVARARKDEAVEADTERGEGAELMTRNSNGTASGGSTLGGTFGALVGAVDHGLARNVIFTRGTRLALILNQDLQIDPKDLK